VNPDLIEKVRTATAHSQWLGAVASVRRDRGRTLALGEVPLRPLRRDEITGLEQLGNTAEDWARLRVAEGFDWRCIRQSSFHGDVFLGRFTRLVPVAEGLDLPSGISHATVANCVIGHDALVRDVKLLVNYVVGEAAVLLDCGSVTCDPQTTFGNGLVLPIVIESGGRDVQVYAEMDLEVAAGIARQRSQPELLERYAEAVADYLTQALSNRGIIEREAILRSTPKVQNTYVGPGACVDGATLVADSTLLSNREEPVEVRSGACVTGSLLQWGSQVTTLALVDRSVLLEHAQAERQGKVTHSILGPNTAVAEGEVTASLLGPFVSFHHQALLIAALWPEGRGNVAYGANVGCNHTSRAPDQEFWPGEGAFLGLGINIKYPADFSRAPYTVVACGVTTLPQKLMFPFSLVNLPTGSWPGLPSAYNELIPAWGLTENLYMLKRTEQKQRARNKARRLRLNFAIFRADTVELMQDACRRLDDVPTPKDLYTYRDIKGLGKNYLLEKHRRAALAAYRYFIGYYALLGLKERVQEAWRQGQHASLERLLVLPSAEQPWEHQRQIVVRELGLTDVVEALRQLPPMLEKIAREVERSKAKDDERGPRIIDDYAEVHVAAADDACVQQTWEESRRLQSEVQELLRSLEEGPTNWGQRSALPAPGQDRIGHLDYRLLHS
jgi:hypothetical protein